MRYYLTKKSTLPTMLSCLLVALGLLSFSVTGYADQSGLLFTVQADEDSSNPAFVVLDPELDYAVVESFELESPASNQTHYAIAHYTEDDKTVIALTENSSEWMSIITLSHEESTIEHQKYELGGFPQSIAYAAGKWFAATTNTIDYYVRVFDVDLDSFTDILQSPGVISFLVASSDDRYIWCILPARLGGQNERGSKGKFNAETTLVDWFSVDEYPIGIALNGDGSELWTLDIFHNTVSSFSTNDLSSESVKEFSLLIPYSPSNTSIYPGIMAVSHNYVYVINGDTVGVTTFNIATEETTQLAVGEAITSITISDDHSIVMMASQTSPHIFQYNALTNERLSDIPLEKTAASIDGSWIGPIRTDAGQPIPNPIVPNPTLEELIVIIKAAIPNKISTGEGFTLASWLGEALSRLNQPRCAFIDSAHDFLMKSAISVNQANKTIWNENINDIYAWDCSDD